MPTAYRYMLDTVVGNVSCCAGAGGSTVGYPIDSLASCYKCYALYKSASYFTLLLLLLLYASSERPTAGRGLAAGQCMSRCLCVR